MKEKTMRKVFLLLAAGMLLATGCKQRMKVEVSEGIQVVDSEGTPVDVASATEPGETFVDIALPGPQGQTVRVRDYVGQNKLVLIDEHGKIIARDLRGEDLINTIAAQLQ